jgi:hypothetical protein
VNISNFTNSSIIFFWSRVAAFVTCLPALLNTLQSRSKLSISCLVTPMAFAKRLTAYSLDALGTIFLIICFNTLFYCSNARSSGILPPTPFFAFTDRFHTRRCASLGDKRV